MFNPKFTFVNTSEHAAILINYPHEDYPRRVEATDWCIKYLCSQLLSAPIITEHTLKSIHSVAMNDLPHAGNYRDCEVNVGNDTPPSFFEVPSLMYDLMPLNLQCTTEDIIEALQNWYIRFEQIHPFEDGNGRVGGIVLAACSAYLGFDYCVACE